MEYRSESHAYDRKSPGLFGRQLLRRGDCVPPERSSGALDKRSLQGVNIGKEPSDFVAILANDMGFSGIGCYGSEIASPILDQSAATVPNSPAPTIVCLANRLNLSYTPASIGVEQL